MVWRLFVMVSGIATSAMAIANGMVVPAYWYPSGGGVNDDWAQLAAAAAYLKAGGKSGYDTVIAIGNVNSGPGTAAAPNYASAFRHVRLSGGKVIGYVWTNYGKEPLSKVEAEIGQWVSFYGPELDGIFLDCWYGYEQGSIPNVTPTLTYRQYYSALQSLIKTQYHLGLVVGNPGTPFDTTSTTSAAAQLADILCIAEYTYPTIHSGAYTLPKWLSTPGYTSKGCVLFYQLPLKQPEILTSIVQVAKAKGAAWIYCTDNPSPPSGNPWGTLPGVASGSPDGVWNAYWGNEQWSVAQAHN